MTGFGFFVIQPQTVSAELQSTGEVISGDLHAKGNSSSWQILSGGVLRSTSRLKNNNSLNASIISGGILSTDILKSSGMTFSAYEGDRGYFVDNHKSVSADLGSWIGNGSWQTSMNAVLLSGGILNADIDGDHLSLDARIAQSNILNSDIDFNSMNVNALLLSGGILHGDIHQEGQNITFGNFYQSHALKANFERGSINSVSGAFIQESVLHGNIKAKRSRMTATLTNKSNCNC